MRAIILSAGRGLRMFPLTANTPKCLIDIGHGKTVLESQLDALHQCGIDDIIVVAGYCINQVRAKVESYAPKGNVRIIHNPFYETSNNVVSLWLANFYFDVPCISINGDDIFRASVIEDLMGAQGDIVMTIDRKASYDSDDMLVRIEGELVCDVGKDLDMNLANGESVGIIKYSKRGINLLNDALDKFMLSAKNHQEFYLKVLQQLMHQGYPINFCEIDEHDWAEIDFHPDVCDVRNKIDSFIEKIKLGSDNGID